MLDNNCVKQLTTDYNEILELLKKNGYKIPKIESNLQVLKDTGEAYSLSYAIQGVLKYHGMDNLKHRTAYFPSISFNNDSSTFSAND